MRSWTGPSFTGNARQLVFENLDCRIYATGDARDRLTQRTAAAMRHLGARRVINVER